MEFKVCGMKYEDNMEAIAALNPNYMGFIFWEPSSRFFENKIPHIPPNIKKVGVFVDADIHSIMEKINTHDLNAIQLHGNESSTYCKELKQALEQNNNTIAIIKAFALRDTFDFTVLNPFENVCDYYLFDTKGALPGGNGYTFDWGILKDYPSTKPYFLSGGIGPNEIEQVLDFLKTPAATYCKVLDLNSKFETAPGLKDKETLQEFKKTLINNGYL